METGSFLQNAILIVGIGNDHRGDDAAGLRVARLIQARHPLLPVSESTGEGTALIELWRCSDARLIFLIDAMTSGIMPGCVRRFDAHADSIPASLRANSSHDFGVVQAVELARVLGCLPPQLVVYGIEARSFDQEAELSPQVEAATRMVAERILLECQMFVEETNPAGKTAVTVLRSLFLGGDKS
jgi:hydrogenase maturation protease